MIKILKKSTLFLISVTLILSCFSFVTSAAGTIISLSSKELAVNQSLTVTVTVNAGEAMYGSEFNLNYDSNVLRFDSGESASGGAGSVKVVGMPAGATKQSYKITFTSLAAGSSVLSVSDCKYAADSEVEVSGASATVAVKDATPTVSANADLKSLTLSSGSLSPKFSASTRSYTVSVPYTVTQCKIYATAADSAAKVDVSGNATLNVGQTTRTITVTASNGTQKTYTLAITRAAENADETTSSQEGPAPEGNPFEAIVSNVPYSVLTDISAVTLPKGFSATTADYNGNQVAAAVDEKSDFKIYYLKATDSEAVAQYLFNQSTKTFTKLDCITFGENIYIVTDIPENYVISDTYYLTNTEIGGTRIKCFASNDPLLSDFYYVYCYYNGKYNMYSYDSTEGLLQRSPEFKLLSNNLDAEVKSAGIVARFNALTTNGKTIVICLLIGIIGAVALIVLFIIKLLQKSKLPAKDNVNVMFDQTFDNISSNNPFLLSYETENETKEPDNEYDEKTTVGKN